MQINNSAKQANTKTPAILITKYSRGKLNLNLLQQCVRRRRSMNTQGSHNTATLAAASEAATDSVVDTILNLHPEARKNRQPPLSCQGTSLAARNSRQSPITREAQCRRSHNSASSPPRPIQLAFCCSDLSQQSYTIYSIY